jgi:hypothetical protein
MFATRMRRVAPRNLPVPAGAVRILKVAPERGSVSRSNCARQSACEIKRQRFEVRTLLRVADPRSVTVALAGTIQMHTRLPPPASVISVMSKI